jgi:plasmid stabilization system protein ParE
MGRGKSPVKSAVMKYKLIIKEEAVIEIEDAFIWYEKEKVGLGQEFVAALEEDYEKIIASPFLYQIGYKDFRIAVMQRFPYKIVYRIEEDAVVVYAVFHTSRNPQKLNR